MFSFHKFRSSTFKYDKDSADGMMGFLLYFAYLAVFATFLVFGTAIIFNDHQAELDSHFTNVSNQFDKTISIVESGTRDVANLLGITDFGSDLKGVVVSSIAKNGGSAKDVDELLSLVRGAGYSVNESTVDVLAIGDKLNYLHNAYVPEVQKLSELINKEKEYRYDKNTFKVTYEGKDYVGLDAYRLVKDLTEGRL